MATFVVAADHEEGLGEANLVAVEQEDDLNGKHAAIDVITEEEIRRLGGIATDLEKLHEVVILAVDVSANLERTPASETTKHKAGSSSDKEERKRGGGGGRKRRTCER